MGFAPIEGEVIIDSELAGGCESESRAVGFCRIEGFEEMGEDICRNARSGVCDGKRMIRGGMDGNRSAAVHGFGGILPQRHEDLPQRRFIDGENHIIGNGKIE